MITFDPKESEYVLTSGRRVYANRGLLSVAKEGEHWEIYQGYDGHSESWPPYPWEDDDLPPPLSPAELAELADAMIDRWTRFKEALKVH